MCLCSIVLYMSILLTLSGRHPHYPSFIHHFKRKTRVDGPCSGVCRPKREQRNLQNEGHDFVLVRWKPKSRREMEKLDARRREMHSFTLTLSHSLSLSFLFSLSLSLSPPVSRGLGVSCNLSIGFSLVCTVTCSPSYLSLLPWPFSISFPYLSANDYPFLSLLLSVSLFFAPAPLSAGFPELIISVFAACFWQGSLAGRKAGWWPLRSWVTQVRCKRCPWGACVSYLCGLPENTCLNPLHSSLKGQFSRRITNTYLPVVLLT